MIKFGKISEKEFLTDYWQKKPLLIKQALPNFISPISPDELAGLSLEEEFESRLITGSTANNKWSLKNGAFIESDFSKLPDNDWTLLVQGVDRFIPEVADLIHHFDFIPRWRFDDVMISYAVPGGSVGPHFDLYDVFLLQSSGKRRWQLSYKNCSLDNYLKDVPLRIMKQFEVEEEFEVEPGDILYIPPKIAHHGVSLDDNCTTLSFGYRSYSAQEMFKNNAHNYYQDPTWNTNNNPAFIPNSAVQMANKIAHISAFDFAKFVTKLDSLDEKILQQFEYEYQQLLFNSQAKYQLFAVCKIAYIKIDNIIHCFINGSVFNNVDINQSLIDFCNNREISANKNPTLVRQLLTLNVIQKA